MTDVSKLGTVRLKNEGALQFKGPATSHCFGVPYITISLGGIHWDGTPVATVDDMHEAFRCLMNAIDEYTEGADQIAWRLYPEMSHTDDGMWTARCRLAVWK